MLGANDAATPEWVTYTFSTAHPILRWLPSKLAEWLVENMLEELAIPEKQVAQLQSQYTVQQLNSILVNNFVPNRDGGHLRTFTTLQWESDDYRGRPKASCYPFDLDGHCFSELIWMGIASVDKIPRYVYIIFHNVLYNTCFLYCCI
jgi:hypothetical protein